MVGISADVTLSYYNGNVIYILVIKLDNFCFGCTTTIVLAFLYMINK